MAKYQFSSAPYGTTIEHEFDMSGYKVFLTQEGLDAQLYVARKNLQIGKSVGTGLAYFMANTYWCGPKRMGEHSAEYEKANANAVRMARRALELEGITQDIWGWVGSKDDSLKRGPQTITKASHARDYHLQQLRALADEGIQYIWAETLSNPYEVEGLRYAAHSLDQKILFNLILGVDGRVLRDGTIAQFLQQTGLDDYGINCTGPTASMLGIQSAIEDGVIDGLTRFYPNSFNGCQTLVDGVPHVEVFENRLPNLLNAVLELDKHLPKDKVITVSGCCGYSPEDIGWLANELDKRGMLARGST